MNRYEYYIEKLDENVFDLLIEVFYYRRVLIELLREDSISEDIKSNLRKDLDEFPKSFTKKTKKKRKKS